MTETEILAQLTEIFEDVLGRRDIVLTRDTTADDIAEWDSFNHINIIVATEMRFGIKFQAAETEELKDVGALIDLIGRKLSR
jgi:acyl carrier protein